MATKSPVYGISDQTRGRPRIQDQSEASKLETKTLRAIGLLQLELLMENPPTLAECGNCKRGGELHYYNGPHCDVCMIKAGYLSPYCHTALYLGIYRPMYFKAIQDGACWEDLAELAQWIESAMPTLVSSKKPKLKPLVAMRNQPLGEACQGPGCPNRVPFDSGRKHYCSQACYVRHWRHKKKEGGAQ